MTLEALPFVLLDDARSEAGPARLYRAPAEVVEAHSPGEVADALAALRAARRRGLHAAGYLAYEAGGALEPAAPRRDPGEPLLWFGLFDGVEMLSPAGLSALLPDPRGAWLGEPRPRWAFRDYAAAFARVREWIEAGDIYQANLTIRADVPLLGHPLAAYAALRRRARTGHGGVVWTGKRWLLSASPELFFTLDSAQLTARPMKGTAPRGRDAGEDAALAAALRQDAKQRAENLMIVDLLRNDLSRVAEPGSVTVPESFTVETYPSVHQMTSRVEARLAAGRDAVDALAALFPCGSVTGAPKIRAMEIIDAVEPEPRGAYTGAIGRLDADGSAAFNVAIRTLSLKAGERRAVLGLGSGVVADSDARREWDECLAKGRFVTQGQRRADLIETMAFDPAQGIARVERHLARMKASAEAFGYPFDRHAVRNELQAATFRLRNPAKLRLLLGASGAIAIEVAPMPPAPREPVPVALARREVARHDFRLAHKTGDRAFYDRPRLESGAFEVVFVDEEGFLTEGSFTSVFVERDGALVTPPLSRGLLPGVLRAELIETGRAREGDLSPQDLAQGFYVGNALRGLIVARLVAEALPRR